jgi:hypothetical protein
MTLGATNASAHQAGVSSSDFALGANADVVATLAFANADAELLARGVPSRDLADAATHGIDVRADGYPCPGTYEGERGAGDGVELHASFACPHRPATLAVSFPLLDELPVSHVHVARLSHDGRVSETQLRSSRGVATLVVALIPISSFTPAHVAVGVLGAAALAVAVLELRRRRRTTRA